MVDSFSVNGTLTSDSSAGVRIVTLVMEVLCLILKKDMSWLHSGNSNKKLTILPPLKERTCPHHHGRFFLYSPYVHLKLIERSSLNAKLKSESRNKSVNNKKRRLK